MLSKDSAVADSSRETASLGVISERLVSARPEPGPLDVRLVKGIYLEPEAIAQNVPELKKLLELREALKSQKALFNND